MADVAKMAVFHIKHAAKMATFHENDVAKMACYDKMMLELIIMFKRKAYFKLLNWKEKMAGKYSCLLEGPRRVGKSTIAEEFAKNKYKSYISIFF